ncbi:MAG: hypothetical protein AAF530_01615 [Pseudomonadota bacterium]
MLTPRSFAFIACRLMAIYLLVQAIDFAAIFAWSLMRLELPDLWMASSPSAIIGLIGLVTFFVLWFGAGPISRCITPKIAQENSSEDWTQQGLLSVGIVLIGIWIIAVNLPGLVGYIYVFADDVVVDPKGIIELVLSLVLGVFCLVGAHGLTRFVGKMRRW